MTDLMITRHVERVLPGAPCDFTTPQWERMCEQHEYRCFYCGRPDAKLVVEHKVPLRRGGGHTASNIVPSCSACNTHKGNLTDDEYAPMIDRERRRENLDKPSRTALSSLPKVTVSPATRGAFVDLLQAPAIPAMVWRSRTISSDAKVLYALLRPGDEPVSADDWQDCADVLKKSPGQMEDLARELVQCGLAESDHGRLYILDPAAFLRSELVARSAAEFLV